ncbi:MAG: hypothetical protein JRJ19_10370 [Deltaproteobacteria bacterium]|nr:hypothetical protein [Deltaproteobacteria bacterium]MBW1872461.1 hypothetical protein [Deltaproteobacteria bacterium]
MKIIISISIVTVTCLLGSCSQPSTPVPSGMIAMFDKECPESWTRYQQMDGRFARGSVMAGETGGDEGHAHTFDITARTSKDGSHLHMLATGDPIEVDSGFFGHVGILKGELQSFEEGGRDRTKASRAKAVTDQDGAHDHLISVQGDSEVSPAIPPYLDLVFCRKD